jgi:hypothetical protein
MFRRNKEKKDNGSGKNGKAGINPSLKNRGKHVHNMIEQNHYSHAVFMPLRGGDMR